MNVVQETVTANYIEIHRVEPFEDRGPDRLMEGLIKLPRLAMKISSRRSHLYSICHWHGSWVGLIRTCPFWVIGTFICVSARKLIYGSILSCWHFITIAGTPLVTWETR